MQEETRALRAAVVHAVARGASSGMGRSRRPRSTCTPILRSRSRRSPGPLPWMAGRAATGRPIRCSPSWRHSATTRRHGPCFAAVSSTERSDRCAREELVEAFLPLIAGVARVYRGSRTISRLELMQEGVVGLLRALERYDPNLAGVCAFRATRVRGSEGRHYRGRTKRGLWRSQLPHRPEAAEADLRGHRALASRPDQQRRRPSPA